MKYIGIKLSLKYLRKNAVRIRFGVVVIVVFLFFFCFPSFFFSLKDTGTRLKEGKSNKNNIY